jgi:hypothetical protein
MDAGKLLQLVNSGLSRSRIHLTRLLSRVSPLLREPPLPGTGSESIKFVAGDDGHKPCDNSPNTGQRRENRRENDSCLVQSRPWRSAIGNGVDDPAKRVTDISEKTVDEGSN